MKDQFFDLIQNILMMERHYEDHLFKWLLQREYGDFIHFEYAFDDHYLYQQGFAEDIVSENQKDGYYVSHIAKINAIYPNSISLLFETNNNFVIEADKSQDFAQVSLCFNAEQTSDSDFHKYSSKSFIVPLSEQPTAIDEIKQYYEFMGELVTQHVEEHESLVYSGLIYLDAFQQRRNLNLN
ncbi:MAG: hypothetical protein AB7I41_09610 [Candidatus Sericytochromatia bacterium]